MNLSKLLKLKTNKDICDCSNEEIYFALLEIVKELGKKKKKEKEERKRRKKEAILYISRIFNWKVTV